ncbi:MAG: hypothetical protein IK081_06795 [Lachnospiraceae bacterium]|nr:hypothetical protein [Lachnospiraceae bacterium]
MDTFMDQLAEKMNAQNIIRANEAGEVQTAAVRLQESADQMMQAAGRMEESVRLLREEYESNAARTVAETAKPAGDVKPVIDEDIIYIVEEEVTQLGKSLEEAKEQLTAIQWDLASKGAGTQASAPAITASTQSEKESASLNLEMAEIRENSVELKHGIAVLQTSLAAIDLEIARLQERFTGYGEDVSQTKEQAAGTKEILDDLCEGIDRLRGDLLILSENNGSHNELAGLEASMNGMREDYAGLAAGMDGVREGYADLTAGVNGIREGYADLAAGVNGVREGYASLTASVNDLRESIGRREDPAARIQEITRELTKTSEKIHADNDCIAEKLNVLTEELKAEREDQDRSLEEKLSGMNDELKEGYHKECVKVYRNVQGALKEENEKQAEQLAKEIGKLTGKGKLTLIFAVLAFVMSLGSLALQILMMLKILP